MTSKQLEAWLIAQLSRQLKLPAEQIDPVRRLEEYGLDSLEALSLTGEIEVLLGRPVDPTILWDHPSIRAVATYLTAPAPAVTDRESAGAESPGTAPAVPGV